MPLVTRLARSGEGDALAGSLLQRARLLDPYAEVSVWEAADRQWWSCKAHAAAGGDQLFWLDSDGPVAGVLLTPWSSGWQCDLVSVPGAGPTDGELWSRVTQQLDQQARGARVEVPLAPAAGRLRELVERAGFVPDDSDTTGWLARDDRQPSRELPDGFTLVDRRDRATTPHPMRHRNGDQIAARLAACSLYDPGLDLAVETADGRVAGYSAYWVDPVTGVGLVEPVRVEEEFQRLGLASAMLTAGIERMADRGASRMKVSWGSDEAGALYESVGFTPTTRTTWYATTWS